MKDEALKLALEELENCADLLKMFDAPIDSCVGLTMLQAEATITAIKQARSAPVQKRPQNCGTGYCSCVECVMKPAPVQEPVAAHSAWVGLTDEEAEELRIEKEFDKWGITESAFKYAVRDIEAKLRSKNI